MSRIRGKQDFNDESEIGEEEINENINQTKLDETSLTGNVKKIELNLNIVAVGKTQLESIIKRGVINSFLKLILFDQYIPFNEEITELEGRLFEYPINEIEITESKLIITSNLLVLEPKNFLVKTIGIFLIDSDFLKKNQYREVLLALYTQEQEISLQNSNQIDLTLTIQVS